MSSRMLSGDHDRPLAQIAKPQPARDARRVYYHVAKLRPRLSPFGLMVRAIIDHGYMLLREPQER